jgi:hypothetical protein
MKSVIVCYEEVREGTRPPGEPRCFVAGLPLLVVEPGVRPARALIGSMVALFASSLSTRLVCAEANKRIASLFRIRDVLDLLDDQVP